LISVPVTARALVDTKVTAADIFSTVSAIPRNNLVSPTDSKDVFLADNVVSTVDPA
jgi:osmoprotectant transport system substrate-binding protein